VFVVHPSNTGAALFVGPLDDPDLAVTTVRSAPEDLERLAARVAREVERPGVASTRNPLLEATDRAYRLLLRQRPPDDAREARIVASMPPAWDRIWVSIASRRDDESPLAPEAYVLPPIKRSHIRGTELALVQDCQQVPDGRPRLSRWAAARSAEVLKWQRCDPLTDSSHYPLVSRSFADGGFSPSRPVLRDADGSAACSFVFSAEGIQTCDISRGWLDPRGADGVRRPRSDEMQRRVCEIAQLRGAALEACRTSLACEGCGSGFCFDDRPRSIHVCAGSTPRFVGGAPPAGIGTVRMTVTCNLAR
jgi:hypothetical protein